MEKHTLQYELKKEILTLANQVNTKNRIQQYLNNQINVIEDGVSYYKTLLIKYYQLHNASKAYTVIKDDFIKYNEELERQNEKRREEIECLKSKKKQLKEQIAEIIDDQSLENLKHEQFIIRQTELDKDSLMFKLKKDLQYMNKNKDNQELKRDLYYPKRESQEFISDYLTSIQELLLEQSKYYNMLLNQHKTLKKEKERLEKMKDNNQSENTTKLCTDSPVNCPILPENIIENRPLIDEQAPSHIDEQIRFQLIESAPIDSDEENSFIFEDKISETHILSEDISVKTMVPSLNLKQISFNKTKVNQDNMSSQELLSNENLITQIIIMKEKIRYRRHKIAKLKLKVEEWKSRLIKITELIQSSENHYSQILVLPREDNILYNL